MTGEVSSYDGFISYSHAADDLLAPRLQAGLQKFAKPWWKRRAVRIFRDESSLAANPHLWSSIAEALDTSGWFVLLLSPDAATSEWVGKEIEHWKANHPGDRILPVVTDGEFGWASGDVSGSAVPPALHGVFAEEPRWVDLRFAKGEASLDLKNPDFAAAIADIASAIRGVPKDELASEEVREHRRTVRTAWAAAGLVTILGIAATGFGIQSSRNATEAERQAEIAAENETIALAEAERADRNADDAQANAEAEADARSEAEINAQLAAARELAAASVANLAGNPELATLLALEALDASPTDGEPPVELINAIWQAGSSNRLISVIETGYDGDISLSSDGTRLAATVGEQTLRMYDTVTHEAMWEYSEPTVDTFAFPVIGPDGRTALPIFDSAAEWAEAVSEPDDLPNRVVILTADGAVEATLAFPACGTAGNLDWSHDGSYLAVSFVDSCLRDGSPQWVEVFETSEWTPVAFLTADGLSLGPNPRFDENGRLYLLRSWEPTLVFEADTFDLVATLDSTGTGDVAVDGSRVFGFYTLQGDTAEAGRPWSVLSFRSDDGQLIDLLYNGIRYPSIPFGVTATEDGLVIVVGGGETLLYDAQGGHEVLSLPTGPVLTVGYDSEGGLLYTSGSDEGPRVWDIGASSVGVTPTADFGVFSWVNGNGFELGPEMGSVVTFAPSEGRAQSGFFDLRTGELLATLPDSVPLRALNNGKFLVDLFNDESQAMGIYDPRNGELHRFFECVDFEPDLGCSDAGYNVVVSVDGTEMFAYPYKGPDSGILTGEILTLDLDNGEVVNSGMGDPLVIEWLTDKWVLGSPSNRIDYRVADRATGEVLWQDERGHIRVMVAPDASWMATYHGDESVQLINTDSWETTVIEGFLNARGGSFNADGSLLAAADADSLRIIDTTSGLVAQQVRLAGLSDVYWIDDDTLIVGTNDGVFGILSISTDELVERTRANLRRSFTDQECVTFRIDPCRTLEEMGDR